MALDRARVMALAVSAAVGSPLAGAEQADSKGFLEDGQLKFLTRNLYWNHDSKAHSDDPVNRRDRREWGQGFRLDYLSGYTQSLLGVGVDLSAYGLLKLSGGRGYAGEAQVLVPEGDGARDLAGSAGGALKLRLSNTELKYGNNLRPYNPVFAPADSRLLPGTATGLWLSGSELPGLQLEAAHLTAAKDFNSTNLTDDFYAAYAGVHTDTVNFLGASYAINKRLSVSLYGSEYEDIWRQYYANANYSWPLTDHQSLNLDFNIYRTDDQGRKLAGDIDVTAWSLALTYNLGPHSFLLTHQRIQGDEPFDYLGLGPGSYHDSIYLANSKQLVDFNGPGERSWGLGYGLDLAELGVPGLSFKASYVQGRHVDASKMDADSPYAFYADDEDHWERDLDIKYIVQAGPAKDLSLRLRHATHRIGNDKSDVSADQIRLIIEYPWEIL